MSDMVSSAFGSLAMMTSVLVSPHGYYGVRSRARHGATALLQAPRGLPTSTIPSRRSSRGAGLCANAANSTISASSLPSPTGSSMRRCPCIEDGQMTGDLAHHLATQPHRAPHRGLHRSRCRAPVAPREAFARFCKLACTFFCVFQQKSSQTRKTWLFETPGPEKPRGNRKFLAAVSPRKSQVGHSCATPSEPSSPRQWQSHRAAPSAPASSHASSSIAPGKRRSPSVAMTTLLSQLESAAGCPGNT